MTFRSAVITSVTVRCVMATLTLLCGIVYDVDIFKCSYSYVPICNYIRINNFYWSTIPSCVSVMVIIIVTLYVIKVIIKIQEDDARVTQPSSLISSVSGRVAAVERDLVIEDIEVVTEDEVDTDHEEANRNSSQRQSSTNADTEKVQRKTEDPNMFYRVTDVVIEDIEDNLEDDINAHHEEASDSSQDQEQNTTKENHETPIVNLREKVQRKTEDPNMFYRVTVRSTPRTSRVAPLACLPAPNISLSETATTILKLNVQTLCLFLLTIPINVINFYVFVTDKSCQIEPDLPFFVRQFGLLSVITVVFYPYLIYKKLENCRSASGP